MDWCVNLTVVVSVVLFLTSFVLGQKIEEVCRTPGCIEAAKVILSNMDEKVDPCQNFYKFACGGFLNRTSVPDDRYMWTATSEMELTVLRRIAAVFNTSKDSVHSPRHFRLAHQFYRSCMDLDSINARDVEPMKERLERLGGWPVLDEYGIWDEDDFDWVNMTVLLMSEGWSTDMLVDLGIGSDLRNNSRNRLELSQPDLGIPNEYLVLGLSNNIVQTYFEMMVRVAVVYGAPFQYAMEELSDVVMFEIELAKISVPQEQMRDHFRLNNPMTIVEMEEHFPFANWGRLIRSCLQGYTVVTPEETVDVVMPSYFEKLGPLLQRVDKRVIANYILWHMLYESLPFQCERVANIRRKLMVALTGATKFKPRWEFCLNNVIDRFEHVVGATYIRRYFEPQTKQRAAEMVRSFHREFQQLITTIPWMHEETKVTAMKKASNIFFHVAHPSELMDDCVLDQFYERMNMTSDDFLINMLSAQLFESYRAFSELHIPVNRTRWDTHAEVTEVNAFYISDQNAVEIPAGILQDIFFSSDRPNYLNYGALGYVIAHELIHSVDDEGKQFNSRGNLNNWWDWETHQEFDRRAGRIVEEYSTYVVPEVNLTLKGVNVQGEVIADHGGIKVAHGAYQSWASGRPAEPHLPGLEQFSPNKLFWLSAATSWCTKERTNSLRLGVTVDVHPPAQFRVNGPFRHYTPFTKDWACPAGSYMNPPVTYNVW